MSGSSDRATLVYIMWSIAIYALFFTVVIVAMIYSDGDATPEYQQLRVACDAGTQVACEALSTIIEE